MNDVRHILEEETGRLQPKNVRMETLISWRSLQREVIRSAEQRINGLLAARFSQLLNDSDEVGQA